MSNAELLALWLALAAGRLRLRMPANEGLRRLSRPLLTPADADAENLDPQLLARAIEAGAEQLYAELEGNPTASPLARMAAAAQLSAFDLELLALAALPCLEEDAAVAVAALTGGERRLRLGQALKLLLGETGDPPTVRRALRNSPLWRLGLLRGTGAMVALESRLEPTATLLAGLDGAAAPELEEGWSSRSLPIARATNAYWRQLWSRL